MQNSRGWLGGRCYAVARVFWIVARVLWALWSLMFRFTKLGKLVLERNSIKAPMEGDNSACDL